MWRCKGNDQKVFQIKKQRKMGRGRSQHGTSFPAIIVPLHVPIPKLQEASIISIAIQTSPTSPPHRRPQPCIQLTCSLSMRLCTSAIHTSPTHRPHHRPQPCMKLTCSLSTRLRTSATCHRQAPPEGPASAGGCSVQWPPQGPADHHRTEQAKPGRSEKEKLG